MNCKYKLSVYRFVSSDNQFGFKRGLSSSDALSTNRPIVHGGILSGSVQPLFT